LKRALIGATLLLVIFVVVFRQRIFLRDPLGKVERNGVVQDGARLYINYSNDVLVEETAKEHRFLLVEGWNLTPGIPLHLACVTGLACWTEGNEAAVIPLSASGKGRAVMSAKEVEFVDESGAGVRVQLR
jgi:hypothetical protein